MPQLRTEDVSVWGCNLNFKMYLHTQTLIHSFIQNQTQRKFYVRIMNKGHMLLRCKSTFKKSGAPSQVNSPGSGTETQKKRIIHLELFLSP